MTFSWYKSNFQRCSKTFVSCAFIFLIQKIYFTLPNSKWLMNPKLWLPISAFSCSWFVIIFKKVKHIVFCSLRSWSGITFCCLRCLWSTFLRWSSTVIWTWSMSSYKQEGKEAIFGHLSSMADYNIKQGHPKVR